jgi:adenylylsulfate kinase-like enzyme
MEGPWALLLTGPPASGKTTLAGALAELLTSSGFKVEIVEGEDIRRRFPDVGFDREGRRRNLQRAAVEALPCYRSGGVAIAALVSPYREDRAEFLSKFPRHVEVYVYAGPLTRARRDPKGLYWQAAIGTLRGLTGFDAPYEEPEHPDVLVDTERESPQDGARKVVAALSGMP